MKRICLGLVLGSFMFSTFSQDVSIEQNETYELARITYVKGETAVVKDLTLIDDVVSFSTKVNESFVATKSDLAQIQKIEIPVGDKKRKGMIIGASVGGGIGLGALIVKEIAIAVEEATYGYNVTDGEARYLMPVAGALVGLGVGALVGKSKKIYGVAYDNKSSAYKNEYRIEATVLNANQLPVPGIRFSYTF